MSDTNQSGFVFSIEHHPYSHIASAFAIKDLEYIKKRVNADRNQRNQTLTNDANRTYESMKTLIDVLCVVCESGASLFTVVPNDTSVNIEDGKFAQAVQNGRFYTNNSPGQDDFVDYTVTASFSRNDGGTETYTVTYWMRWDAGASPSGTGGDLSWSDIYPVNPNGILGYPENFPAPSQLAGKIAENLLVAVKEIWRLETEDDDLETDDGGESDDDTPLDLGVQPPEEV